MPRMYRVIASDTVEVEPGYARHIRQALNDLGLHVRVRRVHRYERLSRDRFGSTGDVMRDVQAHPGCTIRELALRMYPNDTTGSDLDRARAEMKVRALANKLVRAGQLKKEFDHGLRLYPLASHSIANHSGEAREKRATRHNRGARGQGAAGTNQRAS